MTIERIDLARRHDEFDREADADRQDEEPEQRSQLFPAQPLPDLRPELRPAGASVPSSITVFAPALALAGLLPAAA